MFMYAGSDGSMLPDLGISSTVSHVVGVSLPSLRCFLEPQTFYSFLGSGHCVNTE